MGTQTARVTHAACMLGHTTVGLQPMYADDGCRPPSIAVSFGMGRCTGLSAEFHANTADFREFARILLEHCDAAERALGAVRAGEG